MTGLIVEGGARRTYFAVGVMDAMMEHNIAVDYIGGASAGIANAISYATGQKGRSIEIGTNIQTIGSDINRYNTYLEAITILGTPSSINSNAFRGAGTSSSVLNVVWSEGTVANAPWGFTGTINYDYVPTP